MNISLLNPLFLIGLAALAFPIIAHFISRKKALKKPFPALIFLKSSEARINRRSKLRDLILLIIRSLIIALLALIFTKPATYSFVKSQGAEPRSVAYIIDNSYSMGVGNRFELAKEKAEESANSLPDGSYALYFPLVTLQQTHPQSHPANNLDPTTKDALDAVYLSHGFTDNRRRIHEIFMQLSGYPNEIKEVVFITDMQLNGWDAEPSFPEWLRVEDISREAEPRNNAVTNILLLEDTDKLTITATIGNFSALETHKLLVTMSLADERINKFVNVPSGKTGRVKFEIPNGSIPKGNFSGTIEIAQDDLAADDVRYFTVSGDSQPSVLVVDGDIRENPRLSESFYLIRALETLSTAVTYNVAIKGREPFEKENLSDYSVIILANIDTISPEKSEQLMSFVNNGGALAVFLGDNIKGNKYNVLMNGYLPAKIGHVKTGSFKLGPPAPEQTPEQSPEQFEEFVNIAKADVRVKSFFSVLPSEGAGVVLSATEGSPYLVHGALGRGNVYLFTSTADTEWGDFPLSAYFVPTIDMILNRSDLDLRGKREFFTGESIPIEFRDDSKVGTVTNPMGDETEISSEQPFFADTSLPGIYAVNAGGNRYEFAVNVDARESNPAKIASANYEKGGEQIQSGMAKVYREIWPYFLWSLLAVAAVESIAPYVLSKRLFK